LRVIQARLEAIEIAQRREVAVETWNVSDDELEAKVPQEEAKVVKAPKGANY